MPGLATKAVVANTTRGHRYKLPRNYDQTRLRQHHFKARIVGPGNSLPDKVVETSSIQSFKKRLDTHWSDQGMVYNYEAAFQVCLIFDFASLPLEVTRPI